MIVVFWMTWQDAQPTPQGRTFAADDLAGALKFSEELRSRRAAGEPLSHVAIQSELPQSVGRAGVADPPADYAHYKRRLDPSVPLGRPAPGDGPPVGDG